MNSDIFYESKYFHMYCDTVYEGGTSHDLVKKTTVALCGKVFIFSVYLGVCFFFFSFVFVCFCAVIWAIRLQ